jgi:hypothetical protein
LHAPFWDHGFHLIAKLAHAAPFPQQAKTTRDNAAAMRVAPSVSLFIVFLIPFSFLLLDRG